MEKIGLMLGGAITALIVIAIVARLRVRFDRRRLTAEAGRKIADLLDEMISLVESDGPVSGFVRTHGTSRRGEKASVRCVRLFISDDQEYKLSLTTLDDRGDRLVRVSIIQDIDTADDCVELTFWPASLGHRSPEPWLLDRLRRLDALVEADDRVAGFAAWADSVMTEESLSRPKA